MYEVCTYNSYLLILSTSNFQPSALQLQKASNLHDLIPTCRKYITKTVSIPIPHPPPSALTWVSLIN